MGAFYLCRERRSSALQTITTIFPICWFDSRYRWASMILSSGIRRGARVPLRRLDVGQFLLFEE
jgi:hypothetical protein